VKHGRGNSHKSPAKFRANALTPHSAGLMRSGIQRAWGGGHEEAACCCGGGGGVGAARCVRAGARRRCSVRCDFRSGRVWTGRCFGGRGRRLHGRPFDCALVGDARRAAAPSTISKTREGASGQRRAGSSAGAGPSGGERSAGSATGWPGNGSAACQGRNASGHAGDRHGAGADAGMSAAACAFSELN
jgi:hypothetical protein